jgi:AcrR family transcriptional regulator
MPANRPHLERDAKAAQIVEAAESLLLRDGYDSTTMAAIARRAGVSSNAVYWYFPGKDELLAAVLSQRQERALERLDADSETSLAEQARATLAELDAIADLTASVHERARHSAAVAAVHEAFHAVIDKRLQGAFSAAGLAEVDVRMAAAAIVAIVEGVHLHDAPYDPAARDELVLWALRRFAGDAVDAALAPGASVRPPGS